MTDIEDIHLFLDSKFFKKKEIKIEEVEVKKETISVQWQDLKEMELPLEAMFAIGDHGAVVKLSDLRICPYLRSECKRGMCQAWNDGQCSLFQSHLRDRSVEEVKPKRIP